jgi:hypothetical protein
VLVGRITLICRLSDLPVIEERDKIPSGERMEVSKMATARDRHKRNVRIVPSTDI